MKWCAPYRSLLMIYCAAVLVGLGEYFGILRPDDYSSYVDRVDNFPETMGELYPNRPENHYHRGRRAEISLPDRVAIAEFQRAQLEAAEHYRQGLMAGVRSDENLIYNYALTLMRIEAEPAEIEAAIEQWRRDFPTSKRQDLGELYAAVRQEFLRMRSSRTP
jgi:hypothetical protein